MIAFDSSHLIAHAEYLVSQDETELALKCLDMVPGYFRDNKDEKIEKLRSQILSSILQPHDLITDWRELPKTVEHSITYLQVTRGQVLKDALEKANKDGIIPHIVEFGPGDFCFPMAFHALKLKFTYEPITLSKESEVAIKNILGEEINTVPSKDAPTWYVAYEIIEHLWHVGDIRAWHDRMSKPAAKVFLSTPKYTFCDGTLNWRAEGIHHLRTYTPHEFMSECSRLFPKRKMQIIMDEATMTVVGDL